MTQGERIKELRKNHLHLTMDKFGERLGVGKSAIGNIESDRRNVTDQMVKSICREFNVNESWLRTGEGSPFIEVPDGILEQLRQKYNLDDFSFWLIQEYLNLDEQKKEAVRMFVSNAFGGHSSHEETIEDAEAAYKKSVLERVQKSDATASNTTSARKDA